MKRSFDLSARTALVSLGQGIVKGGHLVVMLILVRALSKEQFSAVALLLSIYVAAVGFGTLNLQHSILFFFGRTPASGRRGLVLQTVVLLAVSAGACAALIVGLKPFIAHGEFAVGNSLVWLAAALLVEIPTLGTPQILLASERPGLAALYDSVMAVLQLGAIVVPLSLGCSVEAAFVALFVYAAFRFLVSGLALSHLFPTGRLRLDWRLIREQVVYTAPLALAIGTSILNRSIDKWLIAALVPARFADYAVAAQEVPLVSVVPYAVGAVLATRIVYAFRRGHAGRVREYWLAQTSRMTLVVVPATMALVLCARELITLFFTSDYVAATLPFQIYTVILLHRVAEYGLVLRAGGDTRSLWWASLVLLGVNAALSIPAILWFGMAGAAASTLVANLAAWLFVLRRIARLLSCSMADAFPWAIYLRVLLISALAALATAAVGTLLTLSAVLTLGFKLTMLASLTGLLIVMTRLHRRIPMIPEEDEAFLDEHRARQ